MLNPLLKTQLAQLGLQADQAADIDSWQALLALVSSINCVRTLRMEKTTPCL